MHRLCRCLWFHSDAAQICVFSPFWLSQILCKVVVWSGWSQSIHSAAAGDHSVLVSGVQAAILLQKSGLLLRLCLSKWQQCLLSSPHRTTPWPLGHLYIPRSSLFPSFGCCKSSAKLCCRVSGARVFAQFILGNVARWQPLGQTSLYRVWWQASHSHTPHK